MRPCTYTSALDPTIVVTAKQFGYFSLRWAVETCATRLEEIRGPVGSIPSLRKAAESPFSLSLVFIALHGAAYWMYAAGYPSLSGRIKPTSFAETMADLKAGSDEALKEVVQPNGVPIEVSEIAIVESLLSMFFDSLMADAQRAVTADPDRLDLSLSEATRTFNFALDRVTHVQPDVEAVHELMLESYISSIPISIAEAVATLVRVNA